MMNQQNGPDPEVQEAIHRLHRTELSPLEEVMFQSWAAANQVEDADSAENKLDMRAIYQKTGGKVLPPGQLKNHAERTTDIQTLMKAQEAHDATSPIKAMMEHGQTDPTGGFQQDSSSQPQGGQDIGGMMGGDGY